MDHNQTMRKNWNYLFFITSTQTIYNKERTYAKGAARAMHPTHEIGCFNRFASLKSRANLKTEINWEIEEMKNDKKRVTHCASCSLLELHWTLREGERKIREKDDTAAWRKGKGRSDCYMNDLRLIRRERERNSCWWEESPEGTCDR